MPSFDFRAYAVQRDDTTLEITELPIRKWTQDYKEFLESLIKPEDKTASALLEVYLLSQADLCFAHYSASDIRLAIHAPIMRHRQTCAGLSDVLLAANAC